MSKKFGLRKGGMQKQSEPVTPQFTQCHHSVGCYFIFPPLFIQLWERNGAAEPPNALDPAPSQSHRAKESQLDGLFLYACPYSEFGVLGECVESPHRKKI